MTTTARQRRKSAAQGQFAFFLALLCALFLSSCSIAAARNPTPATTAAASPPIRATRTIAVYATRRSTPTASTTPDYPATVIAATTPQVLATYEAPDSSWVANVIQHPCAHVEDYGELSYEELIIQGDSGSFVADRQLINCSGLGAAGLEGLFWSPDSRYFYFTTARDGVPEGCDQYWSRPFSRVNVSDRTVEYIGIGERSPDGRTIAAWQDAYMLVLPIEAQAPIAFDLPHPDQQLGALLWAPSSRALALIQDQTFCPASGSSVYLLDLDRLELVPLFEPSDGFVRDLQWAGPESLVLIGEDGRRWTYSRKTGLSESRP